MLYHDSNWVLLTEREIITPDLRIGKTLKKCDDYNVWGYCVFSRCHKLYENLWVVKANEIYAWGTSRDEILRELGIPVNWVAK